MVIRIAAVGKCKEKYWSDAIGEYAKRLQAYCRLMIAQVEDESAPQQLSDREKEIILRREGERLLHQIPDSSFCIALAIEGERFSSPKLAAYLKQKMDHQVSDLTFVIGGSLGLDPMVLRRADLCLSISDLTLPHQLARVVLLEQIYRCFRIIRNEPYHK